jgi:hypothetical protein
MTNPLCEAANNPHTSDAASEAVDGFVGDDGAMLHA